ALSNIPSADNKHTVASAALSRSGRIFVGVNVDHFAGACAELVVLGAAASAGVLARDIDTIVAVRREPGEDPELGQRGPIAVLNPCGRCRQVLLDYNSDINVVVRDGEGVVLTLKVGELLPFAYIWPDGNNAQVEER
ncbi:cytidine deaminase-like protein, partial [Lasiosphaeris hirsuta]